MAKRKRLTPAEPDRAGAFINNPLPASATKAGLPIGVPPTRSRPPISQVAGDASAAAALEDMAQQLHHARASGRLIQAIPTDQIDTDFLVRDRIIQDDDEMQALMQSLQARGQQTPVELVELESGRYGLVSGWRRLKALQRLYAETNEVKFGSVLAILRQPSTAADAYLAMIEENEIRVGLSYYERARIAAKAVEQGVYPSEKAALLSLYATASRAKRSKIRSFLSVYHALDGVLRFAGAIPERLGLQLSKALEADRDLASRIEEQLAAVAPVNVEEEQSRLMSLLSGEKPPAALSSAKPKKERVKQAQLPGLKLIWSGSDLVLRGKNVTPLLAKKLQVWLEAEIEQQ